MKRVYFLSFLEWTGNRNVGRATHFEANTDAAARVLAKEYLNKFDKRLGSVRLRCQTERNVKL